RPRPSDQALRRTPVSPRVRTKSVHERGAHQAGARCAAAMHQTQALGRRRCESRLAQEMLFRVRRFRFASRPRSHLFHQESPIMKKALVAVSLATAAIAGLPTYAAAQSAPAASPHTFSGNLSLVSEYRY